MRKNHISIIIVSYNCQEEIARCLSSLVSPANEIIVVDNNSKDNTTCYIKENYPEVTLIENKENLGFARGVNLGIRKASGEYLILLNPDTEILNDGIKKLVDFASHNKNIAAIGPRLLNTDGSFQPSAYNFPTVLWAFFHLIQISKLFSKEKVEKFFPYFSKPDKIQEVDWVTGACICIKKEALKKVGLFDENYFLYFEEIDWCKRAKENGWKIYYYPPAVIIHHLERSSSQEKELSLLSRYESMFYYFRKHHSEREEKIVRRMAQVIFYIKSKYYHLKKDKEKSTWYRKLVALSLTKK